MPLTRLIIKNFKSIKNCDISLSELNVLIGENGTGKTNLLDAISYFYRNLTDSDISEHVFDENNHYSNELRITLVYDLSQFVKISKSNSGELPDIFEDQFVEKTKYGGYYKTIISMASKSKDKKLCVELSQIKGRPIRWNYSYEDRLIFKSLFPIFYIDTRNLDVTEWGYLWGVLGELGKVSNAERKTIETKINDILLDESQEISRKLKEITDIFSAADVSVKPAMSREFAKNLTKVFFSGEIIRQRGKQLGYYSTGTNSVKYIELLLKSIDAISRTKMKEPIVLFDEPEISLHTNYLDELTDEMLDVNSKLSIVVSTHSARLTKNIITGSETVSLFNVKLINKYSQIQRMKKFSQYSPSSKYRVSDDHVNSYFSRGILFVEGATELELFSNPYIRILFPKLKKVDVFEAVSDKPILNIMNPKLTNTQTPYICLIDMDKAIRYDKKKKRFSLINEYFASNSKECFQYRNKHQSEPYLYYQRKHINAMQKYCQVFNIRYTRYADDLLFSSRIFNFAEKKWFIKKIKYILSSQKLKLNYSKIKFGQKELVLNGYVISDREIRLSRNRLSDIRRIVKFSKENHHLIDQFGPEKFILEANKLPLKYRNLNVYPFGTVFQFVQYMCGYRAFLISMTNNNYTLTPFQKELQRLIRRIEAQITRLI